VPLEFDGSKFHLAAPGPNPKHGGVLRMGITNRPPHFDLHQSGTFNNLGAMAPMFDNLIRRDPRDSGQTIIPDLAHSWQNLERPQDIHLLLTQGRSVWRRRGANRRRCESNVRAHRTSIECRSGPDDYDNGKLEQLWPVPFSDGPTFLDHGARLIEWPRSVPDGCKS